jgi:flagellar motility protein MotE (MotC chaperone)
MSRVRLLPIVIVAASGLFVLKTTSLITSGESIFGQSQQSKRIMTEDDLPRFGRVLARMRFVPPADADITGSVPPKQDTAKQDTAKQDSSKQDSAKKDDPKKTELPKPDAAAMKLAEQRPAQPLPPQAASASERAVLERLQERRGTMDQRAQELEMRENLLKAAERKLDGRINELKDIETKLDVGAQAEKAEADKQIKTVVIMYESMKPKEAARVFERLNLQVLVPIVTAMKPARMSEILAAMSPESAEKLTVALAVRGREPMSSAQGSASSSTPAGELARIERAPAPQKR